jgi:hypothetical protein
MNALRRGRPVRGPHRRDVIFQTQTLGAPGADGTGSLIAPPAEDSGFYVKVTGSRPLCAAYDPTAVSELPR